MKPRFTLFSRILFWFFLSLVVLGVVLFGLFNFQFHLGPLSPLRAISEDRLAAVVRLLSHDLGASPRSEWDSLLARRSEAYGVDFLLVDGRGHRVAGEAIPLPLKVQEKIIALDLGPPPRPDAPPSRPPAGPAPGHVPAGPQLDHQDRRAVPVRLPPPAVRPVRRFVLRTGDPTRYWGGIPLHIPGDPDRPPLNLMLLAVSDSLSGNGLFFDPKPWLITAAVILVISILLWLPLVRSITRPIGRMTGAAERIASGRFTVRLDERRSDEIGRLGRAINEMAGRLARFVKGQKRFLGDVAHELASPIARIQLGLGILEQQVDPGLQERVKDVQDEVGHMSELVNELLSFTRAEANPAQVTLTRVALAPLVRRAVEREAPPDADISLEIDDELQVMAEPELLTRALANLVRNAVSYAGDAGPILVRADRAGTEVSLEVRDSGPGVPEPTLPQLFEPFFRPEASRSFDTGGAGLGLAIVKFCVEACQGSVSARNLAPRGFAVTIRLNSPS